ncbi:MAG: hypothetical protein AB7P12_16390, partial [Alphaproteobacteria bacterium]
ATEILLAPRLLFHHAKGIAMARGGYRPGGGRPKGSKNLKTLAREGAVDGSADAEISEGLTPLEYMLKVMRDDGAEPGRRDRMAIAAAPFVHGRIAERAGKPGKREQAKEAARQANVGRYATPAPPPRLVVDNQR